MRRSPNRVAVGIEGIAVATEESAESAAVEKIEAAGRIAGVEIVGAEGLADVRKKAVTVTVLGPVPRTRATKAVD